MNDSNCDDNDLSTLVFDDWDDFGEETNKVLSKNVINVSHFNASSSRLDTSNHLDVSALCCDEELNGFDRNAGPTWIYPTNYSVRDYQYNIVKAALFKNTLVSLPTGLGKTFIAAVVMYNYYRWYPLGKIVFVAPTRPLVAQQIEACYNITAIPPQDTVEMTGSMQTAARKVAWQTKRVFFATPQVVHNDLESGTCPGALVRCLVIDEAHRARGRHSYCQLVEALDLRGHSLYRVLALSATPGSKVEDVINVVQNLHIAHLELRSENCIDVAMYSHARSMQTIVVPLGDDLTGIRQRYIEILDIYTRRLVQYKILSGNMGNFSKGRIIMLFKEYQNKEKSMRHPQHPTIMRDFTMVITLFHALELLTKHGARVFLNFFDDHPDKSWVGRDDNLTCFLERLRDDLGTNPFSINRDTLPDGTVPEITEDLKFGHPKFDHLREVMVDHFNTAKSKGQETKAIVFCEYRESVHLVHCLLLQCRPMIRPHMFIGQGLGSSGSTKEQTMKPFSQKQQLRVMKMFREGSCNVLVSTSVGEEGLDVGNVDLIICFDISNKSPVRLVQRCGRTGRERGGRVVILVTEGKEHQTLRDCIMQRDSLNKRVMQSKELLKNLFTASPRMIPNNLKPQCQKMFITVTKKKEVEEKPKKVQSKIKDMLKKQLGADGKECAAINPHLSNQEYLSMYPDGLPTFNFFPESNEMWDSSKSAILSTADQAHWTEKPDINLCEWMEWQRKLQFSVTVDHSVDSEMFTELLQYADTKRFNVPPSTQNPNFATQMFATQIETSKPKPTNKSPVKKGKTSPVKKSKISNPPKKKNVDIRDLFNRQNKDEEQILFEAKLKETFEDYGLAAADDSSKKDKLLENENISPILIELMVELNIEKSKNKMPEEFSKYFNIYPEKTKCLLKPTPSGLTSSWTLPSTDIIEDIRDAKNFDFQTIIPANNSMTSPTILKPKLVLPDKTVPLSQPSVKNSSQPTIINLSPSSVMDLSPSPIMEISQEIHNDVHNSSPENHNTSDILPFKNNKADFDIGDIDDIFGDSCSPKVNVSTKNIADFQVPHKSGHKVVKPKNPLNFFGLDDLEDIFVDSEEPEITTACNNNIHISPKPNTSHVSSHSDESKSPILSSQWNKSNFKNSTIKVSKNVINLSPITKKITKDTSVTTNNNLNFTKRRENFNNSLLRQPNGILNHSHHNGSINNKSMDCLQNKSNCNMNDTTLFTVTQIIDIINDPDELENKNRCGSEKQSKFNPKDKESSEDSNHSLILCSQVPKKKVTKVHESKKPHLTILETSESSSDESISKDFHNHKSIESGFYNARQEKIVLSELKNDDSFKNIPCMKNSCAPSKRKLNSSDESNEFSPFFKKKPISNQTSNANHSPIRPKPLSLKEKLALRRIKTKNIVTDCTSDDDFCFKDSNVSAHFKNSKKESPILTNINSKANCSKSTDFGKVLNTQIKHVSQLSQFIKPSQPQWLSKQNNQSVSPTPTKSKYIKKIRNSSSESGDDSDSDFEVKPSGTRRQEPKNSRKATSVRLTKKQRKLPRSEFIHFEAELSDDSYEGSSDENEISKSGDEHNTSIVQFLCDEDHIDQDESVDMQAKYLQSVRSPVKSHGKFKIPILPRKPSAISVFSQVDPDEHVTYELDSFCVDGDNELLTQRHDMSELEIAEAILRRRKRRKRKGKFEDTPPKPKQCDDDPAGDSPIAKSKRKKTYFRIDSESSTDEDLFA